MGDSGALILAFPYSSDLSNESKQNPMLALGESISFGRFMSESLSWEKWSTFSHKKYVEEAERYSKPGSVAQKKAFFEAHYKRIAAQKAAALSEQENENSHDEQNIHHEQENEENEDVEKVVPNEVQSDKVDQPPETQKEALMETPPRKISMNQVHNLENNDIVNESKANDDIPKVEKSLLKVIEFDKQNSIAEREKLELPVGRKKKSVLSLLKSWFHPKTSEITNKSHFKTRQERIDAEEQENTGRKVRKARRFLCFTA